MLRKMLKKVARIDRKPAILLQVVKQSDANAVEVSKITKQTIEKIEKDYAQQGVKLNVVKRYFYIYPYRCG